MKSRAILLMTILSVIPAFVRADAPDPAAYYEAAMRNPRLQDTDGELFCWNASAAAHELVEGYEATLDVRWLERAASYFDFLIGRLTKDPDGYEGWIGRTIWESSGRVDHSAYRADAKVGDAILLQPMLRFAELVKADPRLQERFGPQADRYLGLGIRIGWEKWNRRGAYYRDAAGFGSYRIKTRFIDAETWRWVPPPVAPHSENLNKHSAMAIVMLRLWRITGREEFRTRAVEIMSRLKHLFRYFPEEDRVTWNFWMPHGSHDVDDGKLTSWVAVHPNRAGYQREEVARMVEMYDSGLVFDRSDLQRLINANHFMMPSSPDGEWRSSDGSTKAGALWTSLARFDERIRENLIGTLRQSTRPKDQLALAYHEKVAGGNLGWRRRFVKDELQIRLYTEAPQPGRRLSATVLIPDLIDVGGEGAEATMRLVTQTRSAGELRIELLSGGNREVLGELYRGPADAGGAIIMPEWDGTNPRTGRKEPGQYVVRWILGEETRTEKAWVKATRAGEPIVTASSFQGNYLPENVLDGDLGTRWSAEGNEQWLQFDLREPKILKAVEIAFLQGDRRNTLFVLQASADGAEWQTLFEGQSGGKSAALEHFAFSPVRARYVRYLGFGNSDNAWNSLTEVRLIDDEGKDRP